MGVKHWFNGWLPGKKTGPYRESGRQLMAPEAEKLFVDFKEIQNYLEKLNAQEREKNLDTRYVLVISEESCCIRKQITEFDSKTATATNKIFVSDSVFCGSKIASAIATAKSILCAELDQKILAARVASSQLERLEKLRDEM